MQTILSIAELRFEPGWRMPRHRHPDFYELILVTGGGMEVNLEGFLLRGQAGSVLVYPPGQEHEEWSVGSAPLRMCYLVWQDDGPEIGRTGVCLDAENRIGMLLRWMQELYPPSDCAGHETLAGLLRALLFEYTRGGIPQGDSVRQVRRYVRENLAEPLTLADLAAAACLSKYHFARAFRQATGQTPMAYVRQTRLEAARSLLLTSRLSLSVIAERVGLRDEFHLSRVFHRHFDCPPGAMRSGRPCENNRDSE